MYKSCIHSTHTPRPIHIFHLERGHNAHHADCGTSNNHSCTSLPSIVLEHLASRRIKGCNLRRVSLSSRVIDLIVPIGRGKDIIIETGIGNARLRGARSCGNDGLSDGCPLWRAFPAGFNVYEGFGESGGLSTVLDGRSCGAVEAVDYLRPTGVSSERLPWLR